MFNSALQMPVWYHVPSQQLSPGVGHCPVCVEVSPWNTPVQGGQHIKGVQTQKCVCPHRNNSTTVTLMACCMPDRSHHCHHCCVSEEPLGTTAIWAKGALGGDWHLLLTQRARNQPQTQNLYQIQLKVSGPRDTLSFFY